MDPTNVHAAPYGIAGVGGLFSGCDGIRSNIESGRAVGLAADRGKFGPRRRTAAVLPQCHRH
jgi:hypothetical protein